MIQEHSPLHPEAPLSVRTLEQGVFHENLYGVVSNLVTDEALLDHRLEAEDTLADPKIAPVAALFESQNKNILASNEALESGDMERARLLDEEFSRISEEIDQSSDFESRRIYRIGAEKITNARNGRIEVGEAHPDAEELLCILHELTEEARAKGVDENAPFAGYKDNNKDMWRVVSNDRVKGWLQKRPFKDTRMVGGESRSITICSSAQPFVVPVDMFVGVAGFESWQGRGESTKSWSSDYGADTMSSLDVIKHYAGLPSEIPPISKARIYVQPNGRIFCDNGSGDSHRIAAAILRGEPVVRTKKITFMLLQENILD